MRGYQLLSLAMIVKDEQRLLGKLLDHLSSWVSEMVLVDTGSTDLTVEIAHVRTRKVYRYEHSEADCPLDFAAARNLGLEHVTKPWAFQVDADEWPTIELLVWLDHTLAKIHQPQPGSRQYSGIAVTRQNYVAGKPIGPATFEQHARVFRSHHRFSGRIHEQVNVPRKAILDAPDRHLLLHHKTQARQDAQNARYAQWPEQRVLMRAQDLVYPVPMAVDILAERRREESRCL